MYLRNAQSKSNLYDFILQSKEEYDLTSQLYDPPPTEYVAHMMVESTTPVPRCRPNWIARHPYIDDKVEKCHDFDDWFSFVCD